jgi:hypothetical protein
LATIVGRGRRPGAAAQVTRYESFTMNAQNAIRAAMTAFTGIVLALSAVGIRWTSQHQPPASAVASATVLGISSTFAIVALVIIWRGTTGPRDGTGSEGNRH